MEVLKAVREAVGEDMVIEMRVSAVEGIPGGMEFEESLAFMKEAQEYVDIVHVSQGSIFHLSARYCIPTYFREPHKPLNVDYAAEVKKHLHVPVAVVGMITTLEQAEEIIASGKADIVAMAKSFMADGDIVRKSLKGQQEEIRPCTRCDLCGNANTWGTNMSCAINPRCGVSGQIQPVKDGVETVDKHRPITECTDEWWDEIIAIDQSSLFYMMKDTIPHMMAAGKGSIINVSSIGGVFGNGGISYSAAKSAALAMTKNVAIQLAPNGIRCNAVCPGPTPTPLNTPEKVDEFSIWFAERCAQHMDMSLPESSVEDQANTILFFAEDASAAVTGQYLIVDHGTTL